MPPKKGKGRTAAERQRKKEANSVALVGALFEVAGPEGGAVAQPAPREEAGGTGTETEPAAEGAFSGETHTEWRGLWFFSKARWGLARGQVAATTDVGDPDARAKLGKAPVRNPFNFERCAPTAEPPACLFDETLRWTVPTPPASAKEGAATTLVHPGRVWVKSSTADGAPVGGPARFIRDPRGDYSALLQQKASEAQERDNGGAQTAVKPDRVPGLAAVAVEASGRRTDAEGSADPPSSEAAVAADEKAAPSGDGSQFGEKSAPVTAAASPSDTAPQTEKRPETSGAAGGEAAGQEASAPLAAAKPQASHSVSSLPTRLRKRHVGPPAGWAEEGRPAAETRRVMLAETQAVALADSEADAMATAAGDENLMGRVGLPSGYVWQGCFDVRHAGKSRKVDAVDERFVLWISSLPGVAGIPEGISSVSQDTLTERLYDNPMHALVWGRGENSIGFFEVLGVCNPHTAQLRLTKRYINKKPVAYRSPPGAAGAARAGAGAVAHGGVARGAAQGRSRRRRNKKSSADEWLVGDDALKMANLFPKERAKDKARSRAGAGGGLFAGRSRKRSSSFRSESSTDEYGQFSDDDEYEYFGMMDGEGSVSGRSRAGSVASSGRGKSGKRSCIEGPPPAPAPDLTLPPRERVTTWVSALPLANPPGTYEGQLVDGVPHGHGTIVYSEASSALGSTDLHANMSEGLMYEGSFVHGREHGWGVLTDGSDVTLYEGEVCEGRIAGSGTWYFANGDRYEGEWRDNLPSGHGRYTTAAGSYYDGEWRDGHRHGHGVQVTAGRGSWYDGDWANDMRHGRGGLTLSDGSSYYGQWARDAFDGKGECTYSDASHFEGMFKAGKREGRGTLTLGNGATYSGRFKRDDIIYGASGILTMKEPVRSSDGDVVIPIDFQSDVRQIHMRAGFTRDGR